MPSRSTPLLPRRALRAARTGAIVFALLAATAIGPDADAAPGSDPEYGVLVMAHGGDDEWNRQVADAVAALPARPPAVLAFGMADRATLRRGLAEISAAGVARVVVVRLFVSAESFLPQTEWLLGLRAERPDFVMDGDDPEHVARTPIEHGLEVVLSRDGLAGTEPVGEILARRALAISEAPEAETVVLIGHGMGTESANDRLLEAMEVSAETVRTAAPFRQVVVETLREDWPDARAQARARIRTRVADAARHGRALVVPFRLSGFGPYAEVLEGLDYESNPKGLLPDAGITRWIAGAATRAAETAGWTSPRP